MATVYLPDDIKHRRKVAFKVLSPEAAASIDAARFLAEIGTTASLQHPIADTAFESQGCASPVRRHGRRQAIHHDSPAGLAAPGPADTRAELFRRGEAPGREVMR